MRVVLFCHSLLSDWNHGNAHFLRGLVTELAARGNDVRAYEPRDAWSVTNLVADHGTAPLDAVRAAFPAVRPIRYDAGLDLDQALEGASLVLVHEWSPPELVARIGAHRRRHGGYRLFFHDTHHRSVTAPEEMARFDLSGYDAVLAFGPAVRQAYLARGWAQRVFVWHEAADTRRFHPREARPERDLVWIGNYGDGERAAELEEFLVGPVRDLGLSARVHGVRYPPAARAALERAGIEYVGWLPNQRVPEVLARARLTVHVPRRPYQAGPRPGAGPDQAGPRPGAGPDQAGPRPGAGPDRDALPGTPTIRMFEALACAAPLVSAPWRDPEGLFKPGRDYLVAADRAEMTEFLRALLADPEGAAAMGQRGRETVLARHTCGHRVDELLAIARGLGES